MRNVLCGGIGAMSSRTRSVRRAFAVICSGCMLLTVMTSCGKRDEKKTAPGPTPVSVVTVNPTNLPVSIEYVAQTQSSHQVNIHARVNGFLDRRVYTEGAVVKAGQVALSDGQETVPGAAERSAAALSKQKAAMETARLNLERTKPLAAQDALSQKDLDDATGSFESSAAAVEQAKSQLETAQLNLSYAIITSPVTGITGAAQQQDGTYLNQQNSQLTTVAVLSPMWVNFSISENEMQRFRNQIARK